MRFLLMVFCVCIPLVSQAQTHAQDLNEPVTSLYFDDWKASGSMVLIDTSVKRAWLREGDTFIQFPVAVGKISSLTPPGNYTIQQKTRNPWWIPTDDIKKEAAAKGKPLPGRIKPGLKNPLGHYLVRFNGAYAMHGTNQPNSIGKAVSHGCVRMRNDDIAAIFEHVKVGDALWVRGQRAKPVKIARRTTIKTQPSPVSPDSTASEEGVQNTSVAQDMNGSTQGKIF